jgi:predicted dehydrogenase
VKCGVIGCGAWGREIINTLGQLPNAPITALCDNFGVFLRRTARSAPGAKTYEDYRELLADPNVEAVFVATPTHLHRQIVEDALKAGKHVYCEAPLAHTVEDARAIALAARGAPRLYFQSGLNFRSDPQRRFLLDFIRTGAWGDTVLSRLQYHKKQSWRRSSSSPDQEQAMNWRLNRELSLGLVGELGINQLDIATLFLVSRPRSVTGFGSTIKWNDGRTVPDTEQAVFEFANGSTLIYDATLANSFDADYELYHGTDAALMVRQNKAWLFKEVDAPLLGWEVYARKDQFYKEVGIALVANASKPTSASDNPDDEVSITSTPLYFALEAFIWNAFNQGQAVKDFVESFGEDEAALVDHLKEQESIRLPAAGFREGFEATVLVAKANEAIRNRQRIDLKPEWFELA